ncbi:hypothetical protein HHI36_018007 [Cryptolaemus montrouzieri]|uniref:Uncharacterized protein n=1 Tax=Cryptolaemus montrouzieri TaxID=559131 RepID=A0ABD2NYP5_9CUCU
MQSNETPTCNIRKNSAVKDFAGILTKNSIGESLKSLVGVDVVVTDIADIHPLGKNTNCPIKIEFLFYSTKKEILSRGSKLKGTNVVISYDPSHQQKKDDGILRKHMKNARTSGKQVYIEGNRLVVENKEYTIKDLEEGEIESGEGNLEEKTSNTRYTKEAEGSKGKTEGKHQYFVTVLSL